MVAMKDVVRKKSVVEEGEGFLCPNILSSVEFTVIEVQGELPGYSEKAVGERQEYILNSGSGTEWLVIDYCLMKMRPGEKSIFAVKSKDLNQDVLITLQLHSMERHKDTWKLDIAEKHGIAERAKASGTDLIKEKKYSLAAEKYSFALKMLISDGCRGVIEDNHVERCDAIKMNLALCYMKLGNPEHVITHCSDVIDNLYNKKVNNCEDAPFILKAVYRRAWAYCEINEYDKCQDDLESMLLIGGDMKDAVELKKKLAVKIKNSNNALGSNLQKMFR